MEKRIIAKKLVINAQTVNAGATVTSDVLNTSYGKAFSYVLKVSGATADVNLNIEMTDSVVGDINDVCTNHDSKSVWVSPTTNGTLVVNATSNKADGFNPPASKYIRFKVVGQAGNGATTVVSLVILQQE